MNAQQCNGVRRAHAEFDRVFGGVVLKRVAALGKPLPTCGKGCSACCSEPVYVNKVEAALALATVPAEELAGVRERTEAWWFRVKGSGLLAVEEPPVLNWLSGAAPCPLLKNGLCLVYANRPFGCRDHHAVGPPALCGSPTTRLSQKYLTCVELNVQVMGMLNAVCEEYDHLGAYLVRWLLHEKVESAAEIKLEMRGNA